MTSTWILKYHTCAIISISVTFSTKVSRYYSHSYLSNIQQRLTEVATRLKQIFTTTHQKISAMSHLRGKNQLRECSRWIYSKRLLSSNVLCGFSLLCVVCVTIDFIWSSRVIKNSVKSQQGSIFKFCRHNNHTSFKFLIPSTYMLPFVSFHKLPPVSISSHTCPLSLPQSPASPSVPPVRTAKIKWCHFSMTL